MTLEYMAACKFCGQLVAVTSKEPLDELVQQELATQNCGCDAAEEKRIADDAIDRIHQIGGEESLERGFDYALAPEEMEVLHKAAEWCAARRLRSIQIMEPYGDVIKLVAEPKKVKVSRTHKKQCSL